MEAQSTHHKIKLVRSGTSLDWKLFRRLEVRQKLIPYRFQLDKKCVSAFQGRTGAKMGHPSKIRRSNSSEVVATSIKCPLEVQKLGINWPLAVFGKCGVFAQLCKAKAGLKWNLLPSARKQHLSQVVAIPIKRGFVDWTLNRSASNEFNRKKDAHGI